MDEPAFPGCLITTRLVGVIAAEQTEKGHTISYDRLVAVPERVTNKPTIRGLSELGKGSLRQLEHIFVSYNAAQNRQFKTLRRAGAAQAELLLRRAIAAQRS